MTGTVEVLLTSATFANLPEEYSLLAGNGPISRRRFLDSQKISDDVIGDFVSRHRFDHHRSSIGNPNDSGILPLGGS